jgi:outer membrane protein TolC
MCSALLFAVVVQLSGCTTFAPTKPYTSASATRPSSIQSPSDGIRDVGAPSIPVAPALDELTLDECITVALGNNPELQAASGDREAAQAEARVKQAARWPNVHLTGSYFHYQDNQRLVQSSSSSVATYVTKSIVSADVVLRMPLYAGGRIVNETRAADLLARAAEHSLARTREELVFNVSSTYYGILAQRHVIESLEFSRQALQQHLERVENLIAAQKAAKVDALRTEVRLADLDQQLLQERNILDVTHRFLANLLGLDTVPPAGFVLDDSLELPVSSREMDDALARAYRQRPDYAAAAAALEAQAKRVDIARGQREPEVSLEASYGGRWGIGGSGDPTAQSSDSLTITRNPESDELGVSGSSTRPLRSGNSITTTRTDKAGANSIRLSRSGIEAADDFEDVARVGVTLDIPLFEGGRIRAQIAKERAQLHAAQQRLRQLELQIQLEVETAVLNANSARERIAVTEKSITEAEESLRIERAKYDFGKGAIVDVLDAQDALLTAQTSHYRALADFHIASAQVRLATGEPLP